MRWHGVHKGYSRCRALADRHYSRQRPGHPMFTRPGFNQVLWASDGQGEAAFVWFRPKWESGLKGTGRQDKLHAIECTLFRNETTYRSSELIEEAVAAVQTWVHATDAVWLDGLITGVNSEATREKRSPRHPPGWCFIRAGWKPFVHQKGRADVWLRCHRFPDPVPPLPPPT